MVVDTNSPFARFCSRFVVVVWVADCMGNRWEDLGEAGAGVVVVEEVGNIQEQDVVGVEEAVVEAHALPHRNCPPVCKEI